MPSYWHQLEPEFLDAWLPKPEHCFQSASTRFQSPWTTTLSRLAGNHFSTRRFRCSRNQERICLYKAEAPIPEHNRWKDDPDEHFIGLDGKPVNCQFGYPSPCHLYRGKFWKEWIESIRSAAAVKDYGASWLYVDMEFWSEAAKDGCFCQRCLAAWSDYCRERYSGQAFPAPTEFMNKNMRSKEPAAVKAWREFTDWRFGKMWGRHQGGAEYRPRQRTKR